MRERRKTAEGSIAGFSHMRQDREAVFGALPARWRDLAGDGPDRHKVVSAFVIGMDSNT